MTRWKVSIRYGGRSEWDEREFEGRTADYALAQFLGLLIMDGWSVESVTEVQVVRL